MNLKTLMIVLLFSTNLDFARTPKEIENINIFSEEAPQDPEAMQIIPIEEEEEEIIVPPAPLNPPRARRNTRRDRGTLRINPPRGTPLARETPTSPAHGTFQAINDGASTPGTVRGTPNIEAAHVAENILEGFERGQLPTPQQLERLRNAGGLPPRRTPRTGSNTPTTPTPNVNQPSDTTENE